MTFQKHNFRRRSMPSEQLHIIALQWSLSTKQHHNYSRIADHDTSEKGKKTKGKTLMIPSMYDLHGTLFVLRCAGFGSSRDIICLILAGWTTPFSASHIFANIYEQQLNLKQTFHTTCSQLKKSINIEQYIEHTHATGAKICKNQQHWNTDCS